MRGIGKLCFNFRKLDCDHEYQYDKLKFRKNPIQWYKNKHGQGELDPIFVDHKNAEIMYKAILICRGQQYLHFLCFIICNLRWFTKVVSCGKSVERSIYINAPYALLTLNG